MPQAPYGLARCYLAFNGRRELDWAEIELALHAIDTIGVQVEMIGRSAVDAVHGEKLTDVFENIRADIEEQVTLLKTLLGLTTEVQI